MSDPREEHRQHGESFTHGISSDFAVAAVPHSSLGVSQPPADKHCPRGKLMSNLTVYWSHMISRWPLKRPKCLMNSRREWLTESQLDMMIREAMEQSLVEASEVEQSRMESSRS